MLKARGFPGDAVVKNPFASAGDARDAGSILGLGRSPGEGNGNPLQYSCLKFQGQRSLVGYIQSMGSKESDTTEHTHTHTHTQCSRLSHRGFVINLKASWALTDAFTVHKMADFLVPITFIRGSLSKQTL